MKLIVACVAVLFVSCASASFADNKGTCPPAPPTTSNRTTANAEEPRGTITLLAVVSDTGYVCSVRIIRGVNKKADADALKAVRTWRFAPAKKDGRPVPVVITVEVKYEREKDGNVVLSSPNPAPAERIAPTAETPKR